MIRGLYIGSSGMNAQQNRLDAISNNLANVDTAGYKSDSLPRSHVPGAPRMSRSAGTA